MLRRSRIATAAAVLLAGLLPFTGSVTGPARATDGRAAAVVTPAAASPSGCWMVASDGGIFAFGAARFLGSTGNIRLNQPITGMAATPTGAGYWLVASDGGIFAFGDAAFHGSTGAVRLNKPITGMAATPTGAGYWLVASDGGIFAFGDAAFHGSTGALALAQPITGMAATPTGAGYWLTAADGGIFAFGDAGFHGAAPSRPGRGSRTVTGMVPSPTGGGYWQASTSGELLAFGDAADLGPGVANPNRPIVGLAAVPAGGAPTGPGTPAGPPPPTAPAGPTAPSPTAPGPLLPASTFSSTALASWGTAADPARPGYAQLVVSVAEYGGRAFVGGEFTGLVDQTGGTLSGATPYLLEIDPGTGRPIPGSTFTATANPDGPVLAMVVAPDRHRLYVAGKFNHIGGRTIRRLAALDLDTGAVDATFNPPEPNAYVTSLALANGNLYLGGAFATLTTPSGAVNRPGVAAVDAGSGALVDAFTPPQNYGGVFETHTGKPVEDANGSYTPGVVQALAIPSDGKSVLVGGSFLHLGTPPAADPSHQHGGLVSLDTATGQLTPWQPVSRRPVFALTVWPGDGATVFAAAGGAGGVVEAYQPGGKTTNPAWTGHVDGDATGVAATATRVYLVGHYDHEVPDPNDPCLKPVTQPNGQVGVSCPNGEPHRHLAAFDARTGAVDPSFTAQADTNEGPDVAVAGAGHLYVGGNFRKVSDTPQTNYRAQPGLAIYPASG